MSQPALDKYIDKINPEKTIVIADSTLVKQIPDNVQHVYPVEATRVAEEELGRQLFANIVMLGALSAISDLVPLSALEKSLNGNVPPKTIDKNRSALKKGYEIGARLKQ